MTSLSSISRKITGGLLTVGLAGLVGTTATAQNQPTTIALEVLGTYETGAFDEGAAEIGAWDKESRRIFVTNADANTVDVLDGSDPSNPTLEFTIDLASYGDGVNSVAVHNGIVAVAVEADPKTDNGNVVFFDTDGTWLNTLEVGPLPDMLIFTPNGGYLLVANEGEPNDDYSVDPEGSISIIDMKGEVEDLTQSDVTTAGFGAFNGASLDPNIRIFGPNASVAEDLEPEYIAVSHDSKTAFVTLQENNALAIVDIKKGEVTKLVGLGFKDHGTSGNGLDASDRDDEINITTWPVFGMYMPDAVASYSYRGETYLVTANEGDAREYDTFEEEERVKDLTLDPTAFPNASDLQEDEALGRLTVTTTLGDTDNDGDYDALYAFGGRSFSIWNSSGELVWDSGDELEQRTASALPDDFNSNNDENDSFESRSDNKGPEPEGVTVGEIGGRTYAFVGLERVGGIMVYDITTPTSPSFVQYINNRDFSGDAENGTAGDLGPEGLVFVPKSASPTDSALLIVTNEVSGSTTIYAVDVENTASADLD